MQEIEILPWYEVIRQRPKMFMGDWKRFAKNLEEAIHLWSPSSSIDLHFNEPNKVFLTVNPIEYPVYGQSSYGRKRFNLNHLFTSLSSGDPTSKYGPLATYAPIIVALSIYSKFVVFQNGEYWAFECKDVPDISNFYRLDSNDFQLEIEYKLNEKYLQPTKA